MKVLFFCLLQLSLAPFIFERLPHSGGWRSAEPAKQHTGALQSSAGKVRSFNIRDFGATGDGKTDDAAPIQQAIDSCSDAGGGRVLVPAGSTFLTGPFHLKSFVELYVEAGAKLLANPSEQVYHTSAFGENKG